MDKYLIPSQAPQVPPYAAPVIAQGLTAELGKFLLPLLIELDRLLDKRLVRTFTHLIAVILTFRDRANGLLLSELGGYLLSPDMVVEDQSGFVPLVWRQPLPLARAWFGLSKIQAYLGQQVVAEGWYRRTPGPVIELREVHAADGRSSKTWWWAACYAASAGLLAIGLIVALFGIATG